MKKAILLLVFCLGCKTHKHTIKTVTTIADSEKSEQKRQSALSMTDSNMNIFMGKNIQYHEKTTTEEYPSIDPLKTMVFKGNYKIVATPNGREFIDTKDSSNKLVLDTSKGTLAVIRNGKEKAVIDDVVEAKATNPTRKTTTEKDYRYIDTSKSSLNYQKKDTGGKNAETIEIKHNKVQKKQDQTTDTKVSVWNWIWIAIGAGVFFVIAYMTIAKKWTVLFSKIKSKI